MKIIEYFNFKNKPLTKEEKLNIEGQVNEFIELYNEHNLNKDPNNPILNNAMNLAQGGNTSALKMLARNLAAQRGLDFDKEFANFKSQLK